MTTLATILARDPTGRWAIEAISVARTGKPLRALDTYPPRVLQALLGKDLSDAIDAEETRRLALAASQEDDEGYDVPRVTGDAEVDAWERAIAEGREPDWS